jgi:glycine cleavage system H protein
MIAEGLLYTQDHEWVKIEGDTATAGITDYAQEILGEIIFVEMPAVGKELKFHDEMAVVESSKSASDVYCPAVGRIVEVNSKLESKPELINEDCYGAGWIVKLKIADSSFVDRLMDAKQYADFLKGL